MSEITENTISQYLGPEFQKNLMWQILVEPEFAEKVIPDLAIEYFDDPTLKRFFIIVAEYHKEFETVPNLYNGSIHTAIHKFKTPSNSIEEESLFAILDRIKIFNDGVLNGSIPSNAVEVQRETTDFIKQQEYRKLGEFILSGCRSGEIRKKTILGTIEEKINKISRIGDTEDQGTSVIEGVEKALRKEFRETTPTGVQVIDELTGGGLGKGEVGMLLTPSGVGKTTFLTKVANTGYDEGENVLQIIFEDTEDQIKRKHYTIWSKIPLSETDERREEVNERVQEKIRSINGGRLIIKKFSQENTTMITIRNWMKTYEKKHGFKFGLLVLDYLDCLESHKKVADRNEAELAIVKSFLALAADFNIPAWSALQGNRGSFDAKFLEVKDMGGNIKRVQKSHFFMSVAKPNDLKDTKLANVKIIKARFAKDGQMFKDSTFDNDYLDIRLNDEDYKFIYSKKLPKTSIKTVDTAFGLPTDNAQHNNMLGKFLQQSQTVEPKKDVLSYHSAVSNVTKILTTDDIPEIIPSVEEILELVNEENLKLLPLIDITCADGEVITTTTTTESPIDDRPPIVEDHVMQEIIDESEPTTIDFNTEVDLPKDESSHIGLIMVKKITKLGRPQMPQETLDDIYLLHSQGMSNYGISKILKKPITTIRNNIKNKIKSDLLKSESIPELTVPPEILEPIPEPIIEPQVIQPEPIIEVIVTVEPEIVKPIIDDQPMDREEMRKFEETFVDPDI